MFSGFTHALGLPVGPDRIFLAAAVLVLLCARRRPRVAVASAHICLALVVGIATISMTAHGLWADTSSLFAWMDRLVVPLILLSIAPALFATTSDRLLLLQTLTLIGLYLSLTAVCEIFGPHGLVFPRYINDPALGIHFGRARGPFLSAEADGLVLITASFAAAALARQPIGKRWRTTTLIVAPLCQLGAVLSLTRSVWLGLAVTLLWLVLVDRAFRAQMLPGLLIFLLLGGTAFAASTEFRDLLLERGSDSRSVYDRQNTDVAALRAMKEHPVLGIGWTQFIHETPRYVRQSPDYPLANTNIEIHNVVLSRAAELGIPGALLWLAAVLMGPTRSVVQAGSVMIGWRLLAAGTVIPWLIAIMFSPVPYPLVNNLVWLIAGISMQAQVRTVQQRDIDTGQEPARS